MDYKSFIVGVNVVMAVLITAVLIGAIVNYRYTKNLMKNNVPDIIYRTSRFHTGLLITALISFILLTLKFNHVI